MEPARLARAQHLLIGVVVTGAVVIAAIGFAGSYAAVRELAVHKGFGWFANVFPIGIDAGIVVLLALDLLLTWLRIPFPLLRQTAWLLTAATIAFNGAAAWPDPLGVGMHGIIPVLFVVSVEAARHAIGRIADITADKHMESVRLARWLLAPVATFRLWRRMKLWELRSYDEVIRLEQDRLVYRARLRARYGRAWRRRAPVESLMPLRLARYGVPLAETGPVGLAAAGIDVELSWAQRPVLEEKTAAPVAALEAEPERQQVAAAEPREVAHGEVSMGVAQAHVPEQGHFPATGQMPDPSQVGVRRESLGRRVVVSVPAAANGTPSATAVIPDAGAKDPVIAPPQRADQPRVGESEPERTTAPRAASKVRESSAATGSGSRFETIYAAFECLTDDLGQYPTLEDLSKTLYTDYNLTGRGGAPLSPDSLRRYATQLRDRYEDAHQARLATEA